MNPLLKVALTLALTFPGLELSIAQPAGPARTQHPGNATAVPKGLNASEWNDIRAVYQANRHAVVASASGHQARNPEQKWQMQFDGRGFLVEPDQASWHWGLELRGYGFAGHEQAVGGTPQVKAEGQRISYRWDDALSEWYRNDQRGLEHGFTIHERPAQSQADAPLQIDLAVRGDLCPEVSAKGNAISFVDPNGRTIVTYSALEVRDAKQKSLPAHFVSNPSGVRISVDERDAQYPITIDPLAQEAYLKASNTDEEDFFGFSVAVSGDTVVVGAELEDSKATGVNGDQSDNSKTAAGAAYVFVRSGGAWTQQAYLKASNTDAGDAFGRYVAVSGDTVVIGAPGESSNATGINGNQSNNSAGSAGAAYVFVRSGGVWTQQAYIKASNTDAVDQFGFSLAVSGDTLVVGAFSESSNATGINGNQADNSADRAGAAYIFMRSGTVWTQQAYVKASNTNPVDEFGFSVAVSGDTVVVGAHREDSNAVGINGNQADNSAEDSGAAYIFARSGSVWTQQAYVKASNTDAMDDFGTSVGVSGDTAVVGADREASNATGINGNQADNSAADSGAAYVFVRNAGVWSQDAYVKASNTDDGDDFGRSVAITGDTVVIGALNEESGATGINGDQSDNGLPGAGAAYVFVRNAAVWSQTAYVKASNTNALDSFGFSVAISGNTFVVGAFGEDSNATGVDGDQSDNSATTAGAAYVFASEAGSEVSLTDAVSRKTHGAAGGFDLPLVLAPASDATVEPRSGGPTQVIFTFSDSVVASDGTIDASEFTITNASFESASISGNELTLNLTDVVDQSAVTISVHGIESTGGGSLTGDNDVAIRALLGDADQNRTVDRNDFWLLRMHKDETVNMSNFVLDLDLDGSIGTGDARIVRMNKFHTVP